MEAGEGAIHCLLTGIRSGQVVHHLGEHCQDKVGLVVLMVHQKLNLMRKQHTLHSNAKSE